MSHEKQIAKRLLTEINNRLSFLTEVGLDYLTLNRNSASLQEENRNESILQPFRLSRSMYILDEPKV
jgi:excinuclease ABC subunit A